MKHQPTPTARPARLRALAASGALLAAASAAHAFTFDYGALQGSLDSTFSVGTAYRLQDPAADLYATSASYDGTVGTAASVNGDDGNLNYGKGLYSTVFKGTHDLQLKYGNLAAFFRTTYFKDFEVEESEHERTPLSTLGRRKVETDIALLDAYLSYKFEAAGMPANLRFGRQVLSWGESTFIPNGINAINPVDVSRLRTPGSELREALKPVPMVSGSLSVSEALSFDAFYLLAFKKTDLDPRGSYFSSNDYASVGGDRVYLGYGALSDQGTLGAIPRAEDKLAKHQGQFGLAAHYLSSSLGDTEFGLFFLNYHSRAPLIGAITPTGPVNTNLQAPLTAALMSTGLSQSAAATQAAGLWQLIVLSQTNPAALNATQLATLRSAPVQAAIAGAKKIAFLNAAATGRYFLEYPEAIQLYGASFNTTLGGTGVSLQGEVSYKANQPLQIDDVELLSATVSALDASAGTVYGTHNQLGSYAGRYGTYVRGYERHGVWQAQATATKVFGRLLGANQWSLVAELAAVSIPSLPAKSELRFEAPGTYTTNSAADLVATGNGALRATPGSWFADDFSAGAQLLAKFEYNNVFAGVNMAPTIGFAYDILGNTPLPLGNFVEGRTTTTLGVEFTYQNRWSLDLRYANFAGAGSRNLIHDRDYVSTTLKYSF